MPRKTSPRKAQPRKTHRRPLWRRLLRIVFLLGVGFSIPFSIYLVYLDRIVVQQFEGKRFALPAKVYARPLELYVGQKINADVLQAELKELGYKPVENVVLAGQFSRTRDQFDIYIRPFTFWDGEQQASHIQLTLNNGQVRSLKNKSELAPLNLVRLDPITIGGIYPNHGEDRELVRLHQVPQVLIDALIAVEDRRYYQHHGVDPKAILRAATTLITSERVQGGSTITQQLIKNFFLTRERTIERKVKEMLMAILLELHFSKDDILETYLNEVYFGQDRNRAIHGFGLASQFYFSRPIEHLEPHQAALLVGMLKGPAYYNPRQHPKRATERRNLVLNALADQNYISDSTYRQQVLQPLVISELPGLGQSRHPAFMQLVVRQLKRDYRETDLQSEGLRIFTTLDPYEQKVAEQQLTKNLQQLEKARSLPHSHLQGAVIIANVHDGEVKAVVGGRDSNYQGFNRALDASRQIGSLIKPAIYLTALADIEHYNLATPLDDSPFEWSEPGIEPWRPQNYDHEFHGTVPLWLALAKSYNVSAARLGTQIGVDNVMRTVANLGVEKSLPTYASSLLGTVHLTPYEITQMYHTIASGGFKTPFRAIREVTTVNGAPLNRYNLSVEQVVTPTANHLIVAGLQQVVARGTGTGVLNYIAGDIHAAGKTGTTDDLRDSWFAGFTGNRVAVVWVGNDKNEPIKLTGASGALRIWGDIMKNLSLEPLNAAAPENVDYVPISHRDGFIARDNCNNTFTLPFHSKSLPDADYCGAKTGRKVKSWFNKLFGKD